MEKEKRFWIRCNDEQYNNIKKGSDKKGLSMGEYVLCKTLNLLPIQEEEVKEYPQRVKGKNGKVREYTRKAISTKTILQPAPPGNLCPSCRLPVVYSNPRIQIGLDADKSSQVIFNTGCKCKEKAFTLGEITDKLNKE